MAALSFWTQAAASADHPALVTPDGAVRTYGQVAGRVNQLTRALRAAGVRPGDAVACVLPNGATIFELALATLQAGFYLVPVNRHLTAPEVAWILGDAEVKVCLVGPDQAELVRATGSTASLWGEGPELEALLAAQPDGAPDHRTAGAIMNYTSGTTGKPKGVRRPLAGTSPEEVTHNFALFLQIYGIAPRVDLGPPPSGLHRPMPASDGQVHLVGSPLYHTAVLFFALATLHLGHTVVIMDRWTPEDFLALCERWRVTSSHMVPTQLARLLQARPHLRPYDLSSLRHMVHGAAPCPEAVKRGILEWWGPVVWEYYAASEGGGTVIGPEEWLQRPGSVGRPWYGAEIRVLDDDGEPCPPGRVGTVYIRMPQGFAYHKDEAKTAGSRRVDGFFTVGDAGTLDAEGYLFLRDRKVDLIISGGVNIYPAEVEAALLEHPAVADVAVFGVPDDDWGESVMAVVEPRADASQDGLEASLRAFATQRLARYKQPKAYDLVAALPREENGKLARRKLRDPHWRGRDRLI